MTLMDHYDITNKAIQCDPSFDIQSMNWFTNDFNRMRIIRDVSWKMRKSKRRKFMKSNRSLSGVTSGVDVDTDFAAKVATQSPSPVLSDTVSSSSSSSGFAAPNLESPTATLSDALSNSSLSSLSTLPTLTMNNGNSNFSVHSEAVTVHGQNDMNVMVMTTAVSERKGMNQRFPVVQSEQIPDTVMQKWIEWTDRVIQAAEAEANYFMRIRSQYIGC